MVNRRFGFHSGSLECYNITVANAMTINGNLSFGDASTDVLTVNGIMKLKAADGADAANAVLMGIGTSADPATTSTAGKIFSEFRTQSTATSGDSRCFYMRHDINGAGGGGEALRAFGKVTAAASTVRGAHISIDLAAAGTVSGFGAGVDAQVLLGGATYTSTLTPLNLEVYCSASADIGVATTSMMRLVIQGDGTAVGNVDDNLSFINFVGFTAGSGKMIDTDVTAVTGKASLPVYLDGSLYGYIPITTGS